MTEVPSTPESFLDPALIRAQQFEGAFRQLAKTIYLELADIQTQGGELSDEQKEQLSKLGDMTIRMSELMSALETSVDEVLGGHSPSSTPPDLECLDEDPIQLEPSNDLVMVRELLGEPSKLVECDNANGKFYEKFRQAIIPPDEMPAVELLEDEEPLVITIISDHMLAINGETIKLVGDRLFVFNALMTLRDGRISGGTIRRMGFRSPDKNPDYAAHTCIRLTERLQADFNTFTGIEAIKKTKVRYQIDPTLQFIDKRDERTTAEGGNDVKKN
jgi:hypothetical protein